MVPHDTGMFSSYPEPTAFVSCMGAADSRTAVFFSDRVADPVSSVAGCAAVCANLAQPYGIYSENSHCLCGNNAQLTNPPCSCPPTAETPSTGEEMCSRIYLQGAFKVNTGITLGPIRPVSTRDNAQFRVVNAFPNETYVWNFQDGSDSYVTTMTDVQHNFNFANTYVVTFRAVTHERSYAVPVSVLDPIGLANLEAPKFWDASKRLPMELKVARGSKVNTRWSRFDPRGNQLYGRLMFLSPW